VGRLHADDVGASCAVNASVRRLLRARLLAGVSVLANGPATDEALELLAGHPEVTVHVHVNLTEGRPLTASAGLRPLVSGRGTFVGHGRLVAQLVRGRGDRAAIAAEIDAQVDRIATSLPVTGLDTHHHVHALAPIGDSLTTVARRRGLRIPRRYALVRTHTLRGAGRRAALATLARATHLAADRRVSLPTGWGAGDDEAPMPFAMASWEDLRPVRTARDVLIVCHPGGTCDRGDGPAADPRPIPRPAPVQR
jgi:predicted glycoside hydrolase/deacetylase ChbG (UPF0249 family)